ncbi:conjugative transposon protein TraN [Chryseobacterium shandongense]|uniref:Conjugative transposon protein TraN n=1 Tax=Chryseobacterium shandongense TaxID=1493872 RepID=A0AAD1DKD2_9FLAO|nr:conjugative transposon protein TraN [Chryseobacterium shandongense]AZA85446.1 conjugative transposon protein TraN [Chryseobacterium shandongense]AZA97553.1 conjugative transposon protein TraN [Chryseobacterium shandongense]
MKNILSKWMSFFLLTFIFHSVNAQNKEGLMSLNQGRLEPFKMEVTYNKTTHLLFPSSIKYVDLGSENLIANKADDIANVLRVKASTRDFEEETNFSVVTEDGKFYSFDVFYSSYPDTLNYDLLKLQRNNEKDFASDVLFEDMNGSSSSLSNLIMQSLYENPKRTVKHIGNKSFGIYFLLRGLYVHEGKYYFILHLKNYGNIPYPVDFISFKIVDEKKMKRTVVQDRILSPLRNYSAISKVDEHTEAFDVFVLDQFTLMDGQILEIEILEKNGGRHLKMHLTNEDLTGAFVLKDMNLKLK